MNQISHSMGRLASDCTSVVASKQTITLEIDNPSQSGFPKRISALKQSNAAFFQKLLSMVIVAMLVVPNVLFSGTPEPLVSAKKHARPVVPQGDRDPLAFLKLRPLGLVPGEFNASISASSNTVTAGSPITYTINYSTGSVQAKVFDAKIKVFLPVPVLSGALVSFNGTIDVATSNLVAVSGGYNYEIIFDSELNAGRQGMMELTVTYPKGTICDGTLITATVTATSAPGETVSDDTSGDNSAAVTVNDPALPWTLDLVRDNLAEVNLPSSYRVRVVKAADAIFNLNNTATVEVTIPANAVVNSCDGCTQSMMNPQLLTWGPRSYTSTTEFTLDLTYPAPPFAANNTVALSGTLTGTTTTCNTPVSSNDAVSDNIPAPAPRVPKVSCNTPTLSTTVIGRSGNTKINYKNNGNTKLGSFIVTVDFPNEVKITEIPAAKYTASGLNVNVTYSTNSSSGLTYAFVTDNTVAGGGQTLSMGEYLTQITYSFQDSVPAGFMPSSALQFDYIVATNNIDDNALVDGVNPRNTGTCKNCSSDASNSAGYSCLEVKVQVSGNYTTNVKTSDCSRSDVARDEPIGPQNITKGASPLYLYPRDIVTFSLKFDQCGVNALENATLTDNLPSGFTYVPGSAKFQNAAYADPTSSGNTLVWTLPTSLAGDQASNANNYECTTYTLTFQATVNDMTPASKLTNCFSLAGDMPGNPDAIEVCNLDELKDCQEVTILPVGPNNPNKIVGQDLTAPYDALFPEDLVTYKLQWANLGNFDVKDPMVTDVLPLEYVFQPGSVVYSSNIKGLVDAYKATNPGYEPFSTSVNGSGRTVLKWDFTPLVFPGNGTNFEIRYNIQIKAATPPGNISNCFSVVGTSVNGQGVNVRFDPVEDCDQQLVKPVGPVNLQKTHSITDGTVQPTEEFYYTLKFQNSGPFAVNNLKISDMLPTYLEYVSTEQIVHTNITAPTTFNFDSGTGTLSWEWSQVPGAGASAELSDVKEIKYKVRVKNGAPAGVIFNNCFRIDGQGTNINPRRKTSGSGGAENESLSPYLVQACSDNLRILTLAVVSSRKGIKGDCDQDFVYYDPEGSLPPNLTNLNGIGRTIPGGQATYRLQITNPGNIVLKDLILVDILPFIGDKGVLRVDENRLTEWRPTLAEPITPPAGIKVYYSLASNPCRTDFTPSFSSSGCTVPFWSLTPPSDLSLVQAIKLDFHSLEIAPASTFNIDWQMFAPFDAPEDLIAWNSYAFQSTRKDNNNRFLTAEPNKVGLAVKRDTKSKIGNYVWVDQNQDGIQNENPSDGVNGIKVALWKSTNNIKGDNDDVKIATTFTVNDFDGNPGYYLFPNLNAGNYYVVFDLTTLPATTFVTTKDAVNASDETDSDADPLMGMTSIVNLGLPETNLSLDMGITPPDCILNATRIVPVCLDNNTPSDLSDDKITIQTITAYKSGNAGGNTYTLIIERYLPGGTTQQLQVINNLTYGTTYGPYGPFAVNVGEEIRATVVDAGNRLCRIVDRVLSCADYGDLPNTYGTTGPNAPKHLIQPDKILGTCVDTETDGQPSTKADGDNTNTGVRTEGTCGNNGDEDGIQFLTPLIPGDTAYIKVNYISPVSGDPLKLNAFIDFNGDGDFDIDAGNKATDDQLDFLVMSSPSSTDGLLPLGAGSTVLCFIVPSNATFVKGDILSRFRLSCDGGLGPIGVNPDGSVPPGEIEDYYLPTAKIGNYVWYDENTDGKQDANEASISNVEVILIYSGVDKNFGTADDFKSKTTTDANGAYYFCGLIENDLSMYKLIVNTPNNYLPTFANANGVSDVLDNDGIRVVSTNPGQVQTMFLLDNVLNLPTGENGEEDKGANGVNGYADNQVDETFDFGFIKVDFGDLPPNYATNEINDGPRHGVSSDPKVFFGTKPDTETNGQPNTTATGDGADEDGITKPVMLFRGEKAEFVVDVKTNTTAYVYGYIDWNQDGNFDDANEVEFLTVAATSTVTLTFNVPQDAVINADLGARFRIGTVQNEVSKPIGFARDGEVEDYLVRVKGLDFGDLPTNYPVTNYNQDGARHGVPETLTIYLGSTVDVEVDGQQDNNANGDTPDEDGVTQPAMIFQGEKADFKVDVITPANTIAHVYGFIDWNGDNKYDGVGEIQSGSISNSGSITLTFNVPLNAKAYTNLGARFRVGSVQSEVSKPIGFTMDGEVEDYLVQVKALDFGDLADIEPGVSTGDYQTIYANNGPRHGEPATPTVYMGSGVDTDADGQSDLGAGEDGTNGDDNDSDATDDEDGLTKPAMIFQGETAKFEVKVITNTTAYLSGFIDWNNDGTFDDADEVQSATVNGNATVTLTFNVPLNAVVNKDLGARFRFGTDQNAVGSANGFAMDGEVEDYLVRVKGLDFGDLPEPLYATTDGKDGPRHAVSEVPQVYLGSTVDIDDDGQPDADAGEKDGGDDGDAVNGDDEDGVFEPAMLFRGEKASFQVAVVNKTTDPAFVYGYIDWNKDGDFVDAEEVQTTTVAANTSATVTLTFNVPLDAKINMDLGARFRVGTVQNEVDQATGFAMNGEVEDYLVRVKGLDYGDLPATYVTLETNDGPRHGVSEDPKVYLGTKPDVEADGQPDADAGETGNGDATDEDGVVEPAMLFQGEESKFTVNVVTNAPAYVYGYIDWNGDKDFDDAEEVQWTSVTATGAVVLTFNVPLDAKINSDLGARFRIGTVQDQVDSPIGFAMDGEVEDYEVRVKGLDYGDLPNPYATLESNDGSRHGIAETPTTYLGAGVDVEGDGQPDSDAGEINGGDGADENGVVEPAMIFQGETTSFTVNVTTNTKAYVYGYIDWNGDKDFNDANEVQSTSINSTGSVTLTFNVPLNAVIDTDLGARFRVGTVQDQVDQATGFAMDGEVEDYLVQVKGLDFGDLPDLLAGVSTGDYQTTYANNGPRHGIPATPKLFLGSVVDVDSDGQPDLGAGEDGTNGDDNDGDASDDEDGVQGPPMIFRGEDAKFDVTLNLTNLTGTTAYVYGFIDWNGNGILGDTPNEKASGSSATSGAITLTFDVPLGAVANSNLGARFRVGTVENEVKVPNGFAMDGEVEDYLVRVKGLDFGDLPEPLYATTDGKDGSRHAVSEVPQVYLGSTVDIDDDGQPDADAGEKDGGDDGDAVNGDDEDGVIKPAMLFRGEKASFQVASVNKTGTTAYVYGFLDWNKDGDFDDAEEIQYGTVAANSSATVNLTFNVPQGAVINSDLGARFRIGTVQSEVSKPTGFAMNGEVEDYLVRVKGLDFGDLPPNYLTTYTDNAPRHAQPENQQLYFGGKPDVEVDGQPDTDAGQIDGGDGGDEDGIVKPMMLFRGEEARFKVNIVNTTGQTAFIYGYIDWNNDDDFGDAGEVASATLAGSGMVELVYQVPQGAAIYTDLGARFRIGTVQDQVDQNTGFAMDGEVEDYLIQVKGLDFGDAGESFPTTYNQNGGRHGVPATPNLYFGTKEDVEEDCQPDDDAGETGGGDDGNGDDEDGVAMLDANGNTTMLITCLETTMRINTVIPANTTAYLQGWIDFNDDGDWADAGEQVAKDIALTSANGTYYLKFKVPCDAKVTDRTFLRFRLSTVPGLSYTGFAMDGEVEDYVEILKGLDFGDLPTKPGTTTFPTTLANNGPHHVIDPTAPALTLGSNVDTDLDGSPSAQSDGDDKTGNIDDEDGITFLTPLMPGQQACIEIDAVNNTGQTAYLHAYMDYDGDCVLSPLFNIPVPVGGLKDFKYCFTVPDDKDNSGAMAFFRFRLGTNVNEVNVPSGLAMNGEVEDYKLNLYKVGNLVWEDRNWNGLQDAVEKGLGINGVPVALVYAGANGTIETDLSTLPSSGGVGTGDDYILYTTTASLTFGDGIVTKGVYYFCGLIEGKYDIVFFDPKDGTVTRVNNITQSTDEDKDSDGLVIPVAGNTPQRSHTNLFMLTGELVKTEAGIGDQDLSNAPNTNDVSGYPDHRVDQRFDQGYIFLDFGDLPQTAQLAGANFNTTLANNGPRHIVKPDFYLGAVVDAELDGSPDAQAGSGAYGPSKGDDETDTNPNSWKQGVGDDDEDGIKFLTPLVPGYEACIEIKYALPDNFDGPDGFLNAWIDYNGNGTLDAGEKLAWTKLNDAAPSIEPNTGALELEKVYLTQGGGKVIVCFKVPADAAYFTGNVLSRFRLSENPRLSPDGILAAEAGYPNGRIPCGEVEDYFMKLSKVGNLVWEDRNYNGLQDVGEPVIKNVPIKLEYAGVDGIFGTGDLENTYYDTTDVNGRYYFCGLIGSLDPSGVSKPTYQLIVSDPAGMTATFNKPDPSDDNGIVNNSNGDDLLIDDRITRDTFSIINPMNLPVGELDPNGLKDQGTITTGPLVTNVFPDMQVDETRDFGYVGFDYGDLPVAGTTYLTLRDSVSALFSGKFGPRHAIQPKLYLGEGVDGELNGQPDADAGSKDGGDDDGQGKFGKGSTTDDETGVRLLSPMIPGELAYLKVTYTSQDTVLAGGYANKDAYLRSFIDFNGDGDLNDASDVLTFTAAGSSMATLADITDTDNPILAGGVNQMQVLAFRVPLGATYRDGTAFIRHRLSWEANVGPDNNAYHTVNSPYVNTGLAYPRGEVEDYAVPVAKVGNLSWFDHDVTGDQNEDDFVDTLQLVLVWGGLEETTGKFDTVGYQTTMGSAGAVTDVLYNLSIVPNGAATMPPASNDTPGQIVKTNAEGLYSFQGLIPGNYYLIPLKYLQPDSASFVNAYPKHRVLTLKDNPGVDDQNDSDGMPGALIRINDGNGREPEVCVSPQPKGERGKLDSLDAENMKLMSGRPFPDSLYNQTIDFGWVDEPNIESNLDIVGVYFPTSQICGNFNVIMHLCVKNPQEVPLDSLQAFLDLKAAYGNALYTATKPVVSIADSAYVKGPAYGKYRKSQLGAKAQLVPNPNYDGVSDLRLLIPTSENANFVLKGDSVVCIRVEFEIDPAKVEKYPWKSQGSVTARAVGFNKLTGAKRPLTDYFVKSPRFGKSIVVSDLTDEINDPMPMAGLSYPDGGDGIAFEGSVADRDYISHDKYKDENDKTIQNDECWRKTKWNSGVQDVKVALNSKCESIINADIFVPNFDPACGFDKYTEGSYYAVIIQDKWTNETVWTSDDPRPFDAKQFLGRDLIYKVKSVSNFCNPIWGNFILEDKIAPVVKCAVDTDRKVVGNTPSGSYTFVCTDIDSVLNVKKSWTNTSYPYYTGVAVAKDSCGNSWLDNVKDVLEVLADCDQSANAGYAYARITRTFTFTDDRGNKTTCNQIITFRRPKIVLPECKVEVPNNLASASADLLPADLIKAPFNLSESVPYFLNGAGKRIYLTARDYCGFAVNFKDETVFKAGECGRKVIRRWTILDWCYGSTGSNTGGYPVYHIIPGADADCYAGLAWDAGLHMLTWEQHLIVGDNGRPIVVVPDFDNDGKKGNGYQGGPAANPDTETSTYDPGDVLVISTSPMDCKGAMLFGRKDLEIIEQSKWCFDLEVVQRVAILDLFERPTGRFEWKTDVGIQVKGDCDKGYTITGIPMAGRWFFKLRVYDVCYGDTIVYYPVRAVDKIAPTMICDDKLVLSLNNGAFGQVSAAQVDEGSWDNCGKVEWLKVRRPVPDACNANFVKVKGVVDANNNGKIDAYDPNSSQPQDYVDVNNNRQADPEEYFKIDANSKLLMTPLMDSIPFFCCDLGTVMVELWGGDKAGNRNFCWKNVVVEDKTAIACIAPWTVTIHCDDKNLALIDSKVGSAKVFGDVIITSGNLCAKIDTVYSVVRKLKCGAGTIERIWTLTKQTSKGPETTTCKQIITVLPVREYNICFPKDASFDCKTPIVDTLTKDELGCDLLAVNVSDKRYDASDDECYKIFRTYTVINWCAYSDECGDPMAEGNIYVVDRGTFENYGKAPLYVLVRDANRDQTEEFYLSKDLIPNNTGDVKFTPPYCANAFSNNPYGLPVGEFYHSFMYTQIIKVYDSERPVVTGTRDTFCTSPTACTANITKVVTITDKCTDQVELEQRQLMIAPFQTQEAGAMILYSTPRWSTKALGNGKYEIKVSDLPEGTHDLIVVGRDECGNLSVPTRIPFVVKDCKAPAPICVNGLSVNLMPDGNGGGMMNVWATDFVASKVYDCNGQGPETKDGLKLITKYSINRIKEAVNPNQTSISVNCKDLELGFILVELHAWDEKGNHDFCVSYLEVQDNNKVCKTTSVDAGQISGLITTDDLEPVLGVNLDLSGGAQSTQNTGSNGVYLFNDLVKGKDYTVAAQLDKDHLNGVSTFDLVLIQKHILGTKALDNPYRMIAADVNNSKSISTLDMIQIRKLILNIDTKFANVPSWKFVDATYKFAEAGNPWAVAFPEVVNVNDLTDKVKADFIGIKMGDVNGNASASGAVASEIRGGKEMILSTEEQQLKAGQSYTVVFKAKDLAQIQGYQFTLSIDPSLATIEGLDYNGVMKAENFGYFPENGMITTSYVQAPLAGAPTGAEGEATLFTLTLKASTNISLSKALDLNSRLTHLEAYNQSDEVMGLKLNFGAGDIADRAVLRQNTPNPFADETAIGFYLPKATKGVLTIRDVKGALIYRVEGSYTKGNNQVILKQEQLRTSGVFYYTLQTNDFTDTKKMVLLNK